MLGCIRDCDDQVEETNVLPILQHNHLSGRPKRDGDRESKSSSPLLQKSGEGTNRFIAQRARARREQANHIARKNKRCEI